MQKGRYKLKNNLTIYAIVLYVFFGIKGQISTCLPNPLPPIINWDLPLINALCDANRLLGELAGQCNKLTNPHILMRLFVIKEAVLSNRIEGIQATLSDVLAADAQAITNNNPNDIKEINNYIAALEYGIKRLQKFPLSLRLIREIHEKLMANVRTTHHITPGEFRRSQNWIVPAGCTLATATFIPPSPENLLQCLGDLETFLHSESLPPLIQIALIHYQFEAIHPFLDGNGRLGRLLITLFLIERNILPTPLLYLSAFFEATRKEYYARLFAITNYHDWNSWLRYFLNGVAQQSQDAISKITCINQLLDDWRKKTIGFSSSLPSHLINMLITNPFITIKQAAESMGVSYTTAQRAIEKLKDLSILYLLGENKRNRIYYAKDLVAILEEPTKIKD